MGVLLVGPSGSLGRAVFARLRDQGDEVRVIEDEPAAGEEWKRAGGYVALASEWDDDLIERASYEARTVVVFPRPDRSEAELLEAVVAGARTAAVERIVALRSKPDIPPTLASSGLDYVVLAMGRRSLLRRSNAVPDHIVAAAIDAADDLDGHPHLLVDLTTEGDRRVLGI